MVNDGSVSHQGQHRVPVTDVAQLYVDRAHHVGAQGVEPAPAPHGVVDGHGPYPVAGPYQGLDKMGADKTVSTGDGHEIRH